MREVTADVERGRQLGVVATPTVVVNGVRMDGITTSDTLATLFSLQVSLRQ
jgi:protein-disulfide isomerase